MEQDFWYERKLMVGILCVLFFPLGIYALWKSTTIGQGWKFLWTLLIISIISVELSAHMDMEGTTMVAVHELRPSPKREIAGIAGIGELLNTRYFDVTINEVVIEDSIKASPGTHFKSQEKARYLILKTSLVNHTTRLYAFKSTILKDEYRILPTGKSSVVNKP